MREARPSGHFQEACNSLHANKMHRPDRISKPSNIIETPSQESTTELR
jgi:hypothetical protein